MTSASSSEVAAGMHVSSSTSELRQIEEELVWELPRRRHARSRAGFADRELLAAIAGEASLAQLVNVAALPGVFEAALAMPDVHQGYGFPVGGVAAMELPDGVVSPGGVGYDINCGVRLLALPLSESELGDRREALVHEISRAVPAGAGKRVGRSRRRSTSIACCSRDRGLSARTTTSHEPSPAAVCPEPIRGGLATCQGTRSRPDRHDGIEQPLRRGAGGG